MSRDWKQIMEDDMVQADFEERLANGMLSQEESEHYEETKRVLSQPISHLFE